MSLQMQQHFHHSLQQQRHTLYIRYEEMIRWYCLKGSTLYQKTTEKNIIRHAPAPSVMDMALTKSTEILPALRIPHLIEDPNLVVTAVDIVIVDRKCGRMYILQLGRSLRNKLRP